MTIILRSTIPLFLTGTRSLLINDWTYYLCHALSMRPKTNCFSSSSKKHPTLSSSSTTTMFSTIIDNENSNNGDNNNILILDHLNINHEKGRHDWLKSFYIDLLGCVWDPRKLDNVHKGQKTVWANIGAQQFHLPEGKPDAQVLDGIVTLAYPSLTSIMDRLKNNGNEENNIRSALKGSHFAVIQQEEYNNDHLDGTTTVLQVTDPWGTRFRLIEGDPFTTRDVRGTQPGDMSEGLALSDLTIHVPLGANLAGIGRFYQHILGGHVVARLDDEAGGGSGCVQIAMGPKQTLTFVPKLGTNQDSHVDLREEKEVEVIDYGTENGPHPTYMGNYGVHVSLYVADLPTAYRRASALGVAYVNPRFSRRAYTLEQAVNDCMFRCLDIVDPINVEDGPIIRLEHEVRSVVKRDGSKYPSCPFDVVPDGCVTLER